MKYFYAFRKNDAFLISIHTFDDGDEEHLVYFHCKNIDFALNTNDQWDSKVGMSALKMPIVEVIDNPFPSSYYTAKLRFLCS